MLSSQDKFNTLRNFHALDYICFGKSIKEIAKKDICCPALVSEYISTKGAICSVCIEMLKLVEPKDKPISENLSKKLVREAKKMASNSIVMALDILKTKKAHKYIKENIIKRVKEDKIKSKDVEKIINENLVETTLSLTIDSLLIGSVLSEATSTKKFGQWEGVILESSYKILRDNLVEVAIQIKESIES